MRGIRQYCSVKKNDLLRQAGGAGDAEGTVGILYLVNFSQNFTLILRIRDTMEEESEKQSLQAFPIV